MTTKQLDELNARIAWIIEALELGNLAEALAALRALDEELTP